MRRGTQTLALMPANNGAPPAIARTWRESAELGLPRPRVPHPTQPTTQGFRMSIYPTRSFFLAITFVLAATAAQAAPSYRVTDLGARQGLANNASGDVVGSGHDGPFLYHGGKVKLLARIGGPTSYAFDINDAGAIAGASVSDDGWLHANVFADGVLHDLGLAVGAGTSSKTMGINNAGMAVGYRENTLGHPAQAFVYVDGQLTLLSPPPGAFDSRLNAVNSKGQAVGYASILFSGGSNYAPHAMSWKSGVWKRLPAISGLSHASSFALAINDAGDIVGSSNVDQPFGRSHATLWHKGVPKDLGTLGDPALRRSGAFGINRFGRVVGYSDFDDQGNIHAILHDGTVMRDLNEMVDATGAGWTLTMAWSINDAGQIVCEGKNGADLHAMLLTPLAQEAEAAPR